MGFSAGGSDTSLAYVADALTDDVMASLRSAGTVVVLSARAAQGSADYQLSGRVGGTRDGVTVSARLEHADGRVAWTASRERLRRDLPVTADELSRELLQSIGRRASQVAVQRPVNPQVYDIVLRGRYQLGRRTASGVSRSVVLFRQAIALDSTSALGWAWYARSLFYARRWHYPTPGVAAESTLSAELMAADRAVELDPSNAQVWITRSQVSQELTPGSRGTAIAALRRSIALDSTIPNAWRDLGRMLDESDSAGAVAAYRRAVALAPDEAEWLSGLSLHYLWHRDYPQAIRWGDSSVTIDPTNPVARSAAADAHYWSGDLAVAAMHTEALGRLDDAQDLIGSAVDVRVPLARGDTAGAHAALNRLLARVDTAPPPQHLALAVADGLTAFGDTARALDILERFPVRGEMHFQMHLRYERGLDPLRGSPRFQALLIPPRN